MPSAPPPPVRVPAIAAECDAVPFLGHRDGKSLPSSRDTRRSIFGRRKFAVALFVIISAVSVFPESLVAQPPRADFPDFDQFGLQDPIPQRPSSEDDSENNGTPPFRDRSSTPLRPINEPEDERSGPPPFRSPFLELPEDDASRTGLPRIPMDQDDADATGATDDPPAEGGSQPLYDVGRDGFRWDNHRTSVADLMLPVSEITGIAPTAVFDHGTPLLSYAEERVYMRLLEEIDRRRQQLVRQMAAQGANSGQQTGAWEKAFYLYEQLRRLAWQNGNLRPDATDVQTGDLLDPFRASEAEQREAQRDYDLLIDIRNFPGHFVGRPVVVEGVFQFDSDVQLGSIPPDPNVSVSQGWPEEERDVIPLARGTLTSLDGSMQLAMVDARGLLTPNGERLTVGDRPGIEPVPVLVKGWVIKKWNDVPLIYCETMRQISPLPHRSLITQHTVDRRDLQEQERWLYYETLRQMQLTRLQPKQMVARTFLRNRITDLMKAIDSQTKQDLKRNDELLQQEKISEQEYRQQKSAFQRRFVSRVRRYREMREQPERFSTFVDLFQNPDVYHGRLVTLSGHVRHVVSYPPDDSLMPGGRMLNELWLFTDDSQHNPTVIITPSLPADFPVNADVIDRVSVTGCFFKRYVYSSQDAERIAPLILAGRISWQPTVHQIEELVQEGHLSEKSPLARKASLIERDLGRTGGTMIAFCVLILMMVVFGRAQREERDRVRLRKRINELPEFENLPGPEYALPLSDSRSDPSSR